MSVIRVAVVGFGFMGRMHFRCWKALEQVQVTAICDANPDVVGDSKKARGNIEGAAEQVDLTGALIYQDFDKLLSEQKLDAISLTLPTHLHAEFSIKALKAGVNVLCEKPMALNVANCNRMIEAAKASGKVLQVGHCIRFWPEYAKAKEIVARGEYGKVVVATFRRLGAAPNWAWDNWLMDESRSGGMALDMHVHDTDFVQHLFGLPRAVRSFGARDGSKRLVYVATRYILDDEKMVLAEGSWAMMPTFGFDMSFNIALEKATLIYGCTHEPKFRICPVEGEASTPEMEVGDGYSLEIVHFAKQIRGEKIETVTTLEQSRDSVRIIEAEIESVRKGGEVVPV